MSDQPPPLIYISRNGQQFGPYNLQQIWSGATSGHFLPGDMACAAGGSSWQPLSMLVALPPPGPASDIGQNAGMRMLLPVGRSGWAIAAGYLGLFGLIIVPAPLALIFGIIAIIDIRRHRNDPQPKHGMGRAVFGLIVGILGTGFIIWFVTYGFLHKP